MKSSPDFQTGSILLLTATLVCIGLAIAVIAPIIDSPLAGSTIADTSPGPKNNGKPRAQGHPLVEFYQPITRAKHELDRSRQMTGPTVHQASQQSGGFAPVPTATLTGTPTATNPQAASIASQTDAQAAAIPATIPHGSVYAPITIHQPVANNASTGREIADVAERIERLVTERERLAAAVEIEKQRQSEMARRTRRQQAAEVQQQQIARLEQELKLLNQSMTSLQSETSSQLSRLADQNSQIDVASQALNAYREALELAKAESARSAEQRQLRTAEADPQMPNTFENHSRTKDDAGRVRIPELPPMPRHQQNQPAPLKPKEQTPQTAEAPLKRLRVSAPVRIFEVPDPKPEPKPRFLPLPAAEESSTKSQTQETPDAVETTSSTFNTSAPRPMEFIPLEAPRIRNFQVNGMQGQNRRSTTIGDAKSQRNPPAVRHRIKRDVVPDLNVAFEHTYQFESTPIVEHAIKEDVTEIRISTININVPPKAKLEQTLAVEQEMPFQFEAIEFPDLNIVNNSKLNAPTPPRDVTIQKPKPRVAPRQNLPNQLKPVVAAALRPDLQRQSVAQAKTEARLPEKKSWIQKVSGVLNPLRKTKRAQAIEPDKTTSRPSVGGRGRNRHLQRKPSSEKIRLKIPALSLGRQASEINKPALERPSMLQRISHTIQGVTGGSE